MVSTTAAAAVLAGIVRPLQVKTLAAVGLLNLLCFSMSQLITRLLSELAAPPHHPPTAEMGLILFLLLSPQRAVVVVPQVLTSETMAARRAEGQELEQVLLLVLAQRHQFKVTTVQQGLEVIPLAAVVVLVLLGQHSTAVRV
jgi:hypothetical protein